MLRSHARILIPVVLLCKFHDRLEAEAGEWDAATAENIGKATLWMRADASQLVLGEEADTNFYRSQANELCTARLARARELDTRTHRRHFFMHKIPHLLFRSCSSMIP